MGAVSWDRYWAWLAQGVENGWCSSTFCVTHDPLPLSQQEEEWLEQDHGICASVVRVYGADRD